jgi:RNA polymerase sigma-70 factor (ECF subfamily)
MRRELLLAGIVRVLVESRTGENMPKTRQGENDDIAAMKRLASGESRALEELVERHRKRVLNVAYRYMGDPVAAEDLAQEAFIRVYQARKRYKPTAKFSTWLYRIVTNLCLSALRKEQVRKAFSLDSSLETQEGEFRTDRSGRHASPPGAKLEREEVADVVRRAVQALPENQRMAVILNRYAGLGYQEVAKSMELSPMAVKSLLNRARNNLKEKLSPYLERGDLRTKK